MNGQRVAVAFDPQANVIYYDVIGMLIFILSAIFHDPIHDFGLTIERMAKIVLYIDDMIAQLNRRGFIFAVGGGSNFDDMIGGVGSIYRKKGSHRGKKTPSRGRYSRGSPSQGSPSQGSPSQGSRNRRNKKHTGVNNPHAAALSTIAEEKPKPQKRPLYSYHIDNIVLSLPTAPTAHTDPYIERFSRYQTSFRKLSPGNNIGLELLVQVNRLIYSLKLSVVQAVMKNGIGREINQQVILDSIHDVIDEVQASEQDVNSEITPYQFDTTKTKCIFILGSMHILITHMNFTPPPPPAAMVVDTSPFNTYKEEQQPFQWVNLLNGSLFVDIMRVITVGHLTGLQTPPHIARLYHLFQDRAQTQYGGNASKPGNRIMSGGAKMVLSSFSGYAIPKKDELVRMINQWNELQQQQPPPAERAYLDFYDSELEPPPAGETRSNDSRLVRKLHSERFGEMKQMIQRLRERDRLRGEQQQRPSRFVAQLLADPTTYKNVIDDFMAKVKSDFDSLIAEEELAEANAAAADAARPLARAQREAVYNISYLISKKGLVYSQSEFRALTGLLAAGNLDQQTIELLPNLEPFLQIASDYVNGILQTPQVLLRAPDNLVDRIPFTDYMEKDKYTTLLFQLYLLGLIHQHGITGNTGGLPDIDSRLAANMIGKLQSPEHASRYREMGYEYLGPTESYELFEYIAKNHYNYNVMDNGIPSVIKPLLARSTVCNVQARVDPAAGFGGCTDKNQEFGSMTIVVTDLEGRNTYLTKHIFYQNRNTVKIVFEIRLSDGTVISNTVDEIDLSKAPNVLSANKVMEEAIKKIIDMWKNNAGVTDPATLWQILEQDGNFKELMKIITKKGHGDIDQENSALAPNAGWDDTPTNRWLQRHMLFGAGDRPSWWRAVNNMKYALRRGTLFRQGKGIMSYTGTNSQTLAHRDCITPEQQSQRRALLAAPAASAAQRGQQASATQRGQQASAAQRGRQASATKRGRQPQPSKDDDSSPPYKKGGGSKTHRRLYKDYTRYTRKKSRVRK